ncbi:MAG TPA: DUF2269 family protein [Nitrospiraceae bacterium]|nr:DUF2269 family protein [Nitrospiraceae bacterium]
MTYALLRFVHLVGVTFMGAGLLGVWLADLRSRQVSDLVRFAEAIHSIAVFYDGVVAPGAVILFVSGTWMTAEVWGGWEFTQQPWLAGMMLLFIIEFVEGNTVARLYFMRLRRLTNEALAQGVSTPELSRTRQEQLPTFTHFLDIPMLMVIVSLGAIRPMTWTQFVIGTLCALAVAAALTIWIPRLYPWAPPPPITPHESTDGSRAAG